jgi:hypothetical protein
MLHVRMDEQRIVLRKMVRCAEQRAKGMLLPLPEGGIVCPDVLPFIISEA